MREEVVLKDKDGVVIKRVIQFCDPKTGKRTVISEFDARSDENG